MPVANRKPPARSTKPSKASVNGKRPSFRELKAFGLWADRAEAANPVEFTKQIRARIDHGNDAR